MPRFVLAAALLGVLACDSDPTGPDLRYPEAAAHRINARTLELAYDRARETPGILSLLVQRDGVLVAEEYFHGSSADSLDQAWSVTKSVISILTGIALEEGYISSLDQTIAPFLTPIVDSVPADKGRITLRQLITMTSGLQWHELDGGDDYSRWVSSDDMVQYVIDLPWVDPPGTTFLYNTGGTHLLSVILTEATGMPTLEFARRYLFSPLGIDTVAWWRDERGYYTGGMGLWIRPRDMLKIGEMFLREGMAGSTRVVSREWVEASTASHITTRDAVPFGSEYGYLWWIGHAQGRDFYFANGYAGQFILVAPDLDLVVVATSGWRGLDWNAAGAQWGNVIGLIVDGVLPAVRG